MPFICLVFCINHVYVCLVKVWRERERLWVSPKHLWEATFFATLWSLWLVRNDYVFNNASTRAGDVGEQVKTRVAMWMNAKFNVKVYSVEEFKVFLDGIRLLKL